MKPLDVKGAKDLIKGPLAPEKPMKLDKVDVPDAVPLRVSVSTWQKIWAILGGWLNTNVKDAADGKRISLPSIAGAKWIAIGIAIVVIVVLVLRLIG